MGRLTYTTQEVQDRLDSVGQMVRPNLLDNAYFIGGGSQQGNGQLPINQRGSTAYSSGAYSIDRWYNRQNISASLVSGGLKLELTNTGGYPFFSQRLENGNQNYLGKTVTVSFMISEVSSNFNGVRLDVDLSNGVTTNSDTPIYTSYITTPGVYSATGRMPDTSSFSGVNCSFYLGAANRAVGDYCVISAVKLELGSTQTLAHWDDTTQAWVLNEAPNFGEELARCERYYYAMPNYVRFPTTRWLSGEIDFLIPVPVTMRTTPTIVGTPVVYSGNTAQSGFTFTMTGMGNNALAVRASKASHGLTDEGVSLYVAGTALSADL